MHVFIFNEMNGLQLIGCSKIWHEYSKIIGKLWKFIFVTMEMEKLYTLMSKIYFALFGHFPLHMLMAN